MELGFLSTHNGNERNRSTNGVSLKIPIYVIKIARQIKNEKNIPANITKSGCSLDINTTSQLKLDT